MHPVSAIVVFLLIWWTVIFCVLPFGLNKTHDDEGDEYIAPGAPKNVDIKRKFLITTIISVVLWFVVYLVIELAIIDFRHLAHDME